LSVPPRTSSLDISVTTHRNHFARQLVCFWVAVCGAGTWAVLLTSHLWPAGLCALRQPLVASVVHDGRGTAHATAGLLQGTQAEHTHGAVAASRALLQRRNSGCSAGLATCRDCPWRLRCGCSLGMVAAARSVLPPGVLARWLMRTPHMLDAAARTHVMRLPPWICKAAGLASVAAACIAGNWALVVSQTLAFLACWPVCVLQ
jgi:hypothetical protein